MAASAGRVLPISKGNYAAANTYTEMDYVFYNGSSYICKKTSTGNLPTDTEYWQIMCSGAVSNPEAMGNGYATCITPAATAAKEAVLTDFQLKTNGIVAVDFTYNVGANATLNINQTGAKPMWNRGAALADRVIKGGDLVTFIYDGSHFRIISIDRSAGGHTIQNPAGTNMAQRNNLKFVDSHLSDDETNDKTLIEVVKEVTDAQYEQATEDGMYLTPDSDMTPLTANEIAYVNGTVKDALDGAIKNAKVTNPENGQVLVYDSETGKWVNREEGTDPTLANNVEAILDVYGSKNLNSYPYYETTKTINGLTFTVNNDGSVIVNGIASANTNFGLHHNTNTPNQLFLKAGDYTVNGCPSGGASDKYYLSIWTNDLGYVNDYGNGEDFSISTDNTAIWFVVAVKNGTDLTTPITFKPMIRDSRITDDTFVPYAKTNKDLTNDIIGTLKALGPRSQTITADGVKTWNDYLVELCNLVNTGLNSSYWIQFSGFLDATNETFVLWTRQGIMQYNTEYALDGLRWSALNNLKFNSVRIATTSNRCYMNSFPIIPSSASGMSLLTTKPASGTSIYLSYYLYKQI